MDKPNFDAGKCLYYGRADIRLSDHKYLTLSFKIINFDSSIKIILNKDL